MALRFAWGLVSVAAAANALGGAEPWNPSADPAAEVVVAGDAPNTAAALLRSAARFTVLTPRLIRMGVVAGRPLRGPRELCRREPTPAGTGFSRGPQVRGRHPPHRRVDAALRGARRAVWPSQPRRGPQGRGEAGHLDLWPTRARQPPGYGPHPRCGLRIDDDSPRPDQPRRLGGLRRQQFRRAGGRPPRVGRRPAAGPSRFRPRRGRRSRALRPPGAGAQQQRRADGRLPVECRPPGLLLLRPRPRLQGRAGRLPRHRRRDPAAAPLGLRRMVEPLLALLGGRAEDARRRVPRPRSAAGRPGRRYGLAPARLDGLYLEPEVLPGPQAVPRLGARRGAEGHAEPPPRRRRRQARGGFHERGAGDGPRGFADDDGGGREGALRLRRPAVHARLLRLPSPAAGGARRRFLVGSTGSRARPSTRCRPSIPCLG